MEGALFAESDKNQLLYVLTWQDSIDYKKDPLRREGQYHGGSCETSSATGLSGIRQLRLLQKQHFSGLDEIFCLYLIKINP